MCYSTIRARGGSGRPRESRPRAPPSKKIASHHPQSHRGSARSPRQRAAASISPYNYRMPRVTRLERGNGEGQRPTGGRGRDEWRKRHRPKTERLSSWRTKALKVRVSADGRAGCRAAEGRTACADATPQLKADEMGIARCSVTARRRAARSRRARGAVAGPARFRHLVPPTPLKSADAEPLLRHDLREGEALGLGHGAARLDAHDVTDLSGVLLVVEGELRLVDELLVPGWGTLRATSTTPDLSIAVDTTLPSSTCLAVTARARDGRKWREPPSPRRACP